MFEIKEEEMRGRKLFILIVFVFLIIPIFSGGFAPMIVEGVVLMFGYSLISETTMMTIHSYALGFVVGGVLLSIVTGTLVLLHEEVRKPLLSDIE